MHVRHFIRIRIWTPSVSLQFFIPAPPGVVINHFFWEIWHFRDFQKLVPSGSKCFRLLSPSHLLITSPCAQYRCCRFEREKSNYVHTSHDYIYKSRGEPLLWKRIWALGWFWAGFRLVLGLFWACGQY